MHNNIIVHYGYRIHLIADVAGIVGRYHSLGHTLSNNTYLARCAERTWLDLTRVWITLHAPTASRPT